MPIPPTSCRQCQCTCPPSCCSMRLPQCRIYSVEVFDLLLLPGRHEDPARALRADWTFHHFAGVRRLELRALCALLIAVRMILISNRLLRDLRRRGGRVRQGTADHHATGRAYRVLQKCAPAKRRRPGTHVTPQLSASKDRRFEPYDSLRGGLFRAPSDRDRQAMKRWE